MKNILIILIVLTSSLVTANAQSALKNTYWGQNKKELIKKVPGAVTYSTSNNIVFVHEIVKGTRINTCYYFEDNKLTHVKVKLVPTLRERNNERKLHLSSIKNALKNNYGESITYKKGKITVFTYKKKDLVIKYFYGNLGARTIDEVVYSPEKPVIPTMEERYTIML